jgi:Asp/Glu/hydantoin racemase
MKTILVLNPNSSVAVTETMLRACAALPLPVGHRVDFRTLDQGPPAIESQRDVESVVLPVCDYFQAHPADVFVIGCFSDPGLYLAREELSSPVIGISESALLAAIGLGSRFGILAIKQGSIRRHMRLVNQLGLAGRCAADRSLDLGVAELLDAEISIARIIDVGRCLRDEDGADVLILGCATMGVYRARLEAELGIPVVDPTQAAVMRAASLLSLNYARIT